MEKAASLGITPLLLAHLIEDLGREAEEREALENLVMWPGVPHPLEVEKLSSAAKNTHTHAREGGIMYNQTLGNLGRSLVAGGMQKTAGMDQSPLKAIMEDYRQRTGQNGLQKTAGLGSALSGLGGKVTNLARSNAALPIAGGVLGAGAATPAALREFGEGDTLAGLGYLAGGAGLGTGAGFLGRSAARLGQRSAELGRTQHRLAANLGPQADVAALTPGSQGKLNSIFGLAKGRRTGMRNAFYDAKAQLYQNARRAAQQAKASAGVGAFGQFAG